MLLSLMVTTIFSSKGTCTATLKKRMLEKNIGVFVTFKNPLFVTSYENAVFSAEEDVATETADAAEVVVVAAAASVVVSSQAEEQNLDNVDDSVADVDEPDGPFVLQFAAKVDQLYDDAWFGVPRLCSHAAVKVEDCNFCLKLEVATSCFK